MYLITPRSSIDGYDMCEHQISISEYAIDTENIEKQ